jgi:hypothetical protein
MKSMTTQRSKVTINRPKNIQKKGPGKLNYLPCLLNKYKQIKQNINLCKIIISMQSNQYLYELLDQIIQYMVIFFIEICYMVALSINICKTHRIKSKINIKDIIEITL